MGADLSSHKLEAISVIERVCSVLSLLGCIFIITTFCCSTYFHKPINRLVFYASIGNMLVNVGTLMSRTYVDSPDSVGCQFQGFIIQMFMPADALWTLAMAINVYLTFYFRFNAERLRKIEPIYMACCYGIPFVPALTYIFLEDSDGNRVYGDANLWCWISKEWDMWRISTFYGPVWVVMVATMLIYIRAGRTIYEKRQLLHNVGSSDPQISFADDSPSTVKTTEVIITTEAVDGGSAIPMRSIRHQTSGSRDASRSDNNYSVTISARPVPALVKSEGGDSPELDARPDTSTPMGVQRPQHSQRNRNYDLNNAAWSYTKCAILFFSAMLITWIPSSANRVYSVIHTHKTSGPLEVMSAFVLPLQGFWNAIIYVVTSWNAFKMLLMDIRLGRRPDVNEIVDSIRPQEGHGRRTLRKTTVGPNHRMFASESMTELAGDRQTSGDERPQSSQGRPASSSN